VTLIDPDQALPASLRVDLAYRTRLPFQLDGTFRYLHSWGRGLWGYQDLNLDEARHQQLGPDGRLFFGDPPPSAATQAPCPWPAHDCSMISPTCTT
jgi:hypothetical protein